MSRKSNDPKRIALIGGSVTVGGTEVFNRRLRGLLERGHHQVRALRLHSHRDGQSALKHGAKLAATSLRALGFTATKRPDRIIVSAANILDVMAADVMARLTGRRDIYLVCHFSATWRFWQMPRLVTRFVRASRRLRVFAISENQRAFFQSKGVRCEDELFPNLIHFEPAERQPRAPHTPGSTVELLYAGRIVPEKNVHELAGFLASLADDSLPLHLTLVGKAPPRYVDRISANIGPHFDITFLGQTDEAGVNAAMCAADVFASFSASDTLPLNMLEAATHGLPILAPHTEVTEDVARLTDQVIFVEPDMRPDTARKMLRKTLALPHSASAKALVAANEVRAFKLLDLSGWEA